MAVTTGSKRTPARERASSSTELWTWLFMRVSGLVLVFLVLGHFTIVHLLDGGIDRINFKFVAGRWSNPLWQTWDWTMLSLGLLHGTNGVKTLINEYVSKPGKRTLLKSILYVLTLVFLLLGTVVIVAFDPTKGTGF
ncbi:MAG: succinate dehydrogenase hydrophobic membrane anchor subunit [Actinomycetota bacterium]